MAAVFILYGNYNIDQTRTPDLVLKTDLLFDSGELDSLKYCRQKVIIMIL